MKNHRRLGMLFIPIILTCTIVAVFTLLPRAHAQHGDQPPASPSTRTVVPPPENQCSSLAEECYSLLSAPPSGDSIRSFTCRTNVELLDTSYGSGTSSLVDIVMSKDRVRVEGREFLMVRDSIDLLLVTPERRSIYLYSVDRADEGTSDAADFMSARTALFESCQVVECVDEKDGAGGKSKRIRFSPDPAKRRTTNIEEFTVWLEPDSKTIRRVLLIPHRMREYRSISWTFSDIESRPAPAQFHQPIDREVLSNRGKLKNSYAGFSLTDERVR